MGQQTRKFVPLKVQRPKNTETPVLGANIEWTTAVVMCVKKIC